MNATCQLVTRRLGSSIRPRIAASVRQAHSSALTKQDKSLMRTVFTTGTIVMLGGVAYGVSLLDLVLDTLPIDFTASRSEKS
jgi:hypothetical protein